MFIIFSHFVVFSDRGIYALYTIASVALVLFIKLHSVTLCLFVFVNYFIKKFTMF